MSTAWTVTIQSIEWFVVVGGVGVVVVVAAVVVVVAVVVVAVVVAASGAGVEANLWFLLLAVHDLFLKSTHGLWIVCTQPTTPPPKYFLIVMQAGHSWFLEVYHVTVKTIKINKIWQPCSINFTLPTRRYGTIHIKPLDFPETLFTAHLLCFSFQKISMSFFSFQKPVNCWREIRFMANSGADPGRPCVRWSHCCRDPKNERPSATRVQPEDLATSNGVFGLQMVCG